MCDPFAGRHLMRIVYKDSAGLSDTCHGCLDRVHPKLEQLETCMCRRKRPGAVKRYLGPERPDLDYARASLRAVGMGYLRFAGVETGLLGTAFGEHFDRSVPPDRRALGRSDLDPFQLLGAALDRRVLTEGISRAQRPAADYLASLAGPRHGAAGDQWPFKGLVAAGIRTTRTTACRIKRGLT